MKLTNKLKQEIDNYFNNISSEELYDIAKKYKIVEISEELDPSIKRCSYCESKNVEVETDGIWCNECNI